VAIYLAGYFEKAKERVSQWLKAKGPPVQVKVLPDLSLMKGGNLCVIL
jgi:hypothetical protein